MLASGASSLRGDAERQIWRQSATGATCEEAVKPLGMVFKTPVAAFTEATYST